MGAAAIGVVLFLLPAVGWSGVLRPSSRALGVRLAAHVLVSTGVLIGAVAAIALVGQPLTASAAWTAVWGATMLGLVASAMRRPAPATRRALTSRETGIGLACAGGAFVFFLWGATVVVPPLEDQDLEVTGTAVSLLTRFEPLLLTDRGGTYFFAHPPLLHAWVGGAHLLSGSLPDLRVYDDSSRRVHDARAGRTVEPPDGPIRLHGHPLDLPVQPGDYEVVSVTGTQYRLVGEDGVAVDVPIDAVELDRIYAHYRAHPLRLASRAANVFLAAGTVALLAIWAGRISRRWGLGVLVAVTYATSPEVFVRSSYGGYFAAGGFVSLLMLLASEAWSRSPSTGHTRLAVLAGALAALIDHKLIVLPVVLGGLHLWRRWSDGPGSRDGAWVHPVAAGFVAGTTAFWVWGLWLSPDAFIADHIRGHLVDRVLHHNPLGYGGYLSPAGLWVEFMRHTGWLLLPGGLALLGLDLWRRQSGAGRFIPDRPVWLAWMLVTAAAFTAIDWRMTKHVMPLALPLCLALTPGHRAARHRVAMAVAVCLVVLLLNAVDLRTLALTFDAFRVTPIW